MSRFDASLASMAVLAPALSGGVNRDFDAQTAAVPERLTKFRGAPSRNYLIFESPSKPEDPQFTAMDTWVAFLGFDP